MAKRNLKSADSFTQRDVAASNSVAEDSSGTLADVVYRRLRTDIIRGALTPGMPLRSDDLRARYDVGVSPLREALARIANEELVNSSEYRGFRVAPLRPQDVIEIADMRILIEGEALRRSIRRGDLAWEGQIVARAHAMTRMFNEPGYEAEGEAWSDLHLRFHLALIDACECEWMLRFARLLYGHAERHRLVAEKSRVKVELKNVSFRRDRIDEHQQLVDATLARDEEAAVDVLTHHHRLTAEYVLAALGHSQVSIADTQKKSGVERPKKSAKKKSGGKRPRKSVAKKSGVKRPRKAVSSR
jgi:GntR family carbon starvation induced transcriptional regulator